MLQQGQVFPLTSRDGGKKRWAYRYRIGGRGSRRVQRGGFASDREVGKREAVARPAAALMQPDQDSLVLGLPAAPVLSAAACCREREKKDR